MQKSTVYGITNFLKMHYKDTSTDLAELFCQEIPTNKKEKNAWTDTFMVVRFHDWLLYVVHLLFSVTLLV
jgi:hypothetical protein